MTEFAKSRKIYIYKHDKCDPPIVVFMRAKQRLAEERYNVFYNNCEHFAHYCKTGEPISPQVEKAKEIIGDNGVAFADDLSQNFINVINLVQSSKKSIEDTLNEWRNKDDENRDDSFLKLF